MKKVLLVCAIILGLASSASAKETLSVAFVFDKKTLNLTLDQRKDLSDEYMKKLAETFENSGLSSTIGFTKVAVAYRYISKSGENFSSLRKRYVDNESDLKYRYGKPVPSQTLQYYQRYYKADIVIGVVNFPSENTSGIAFSTPSKRHTVEKSNTDVLAYGDYGICFLNYKYRNQKEQPAHEIGHGFGLSHGKKVGHTLGSNAIEKYANGFGSTDYGRNYGTVMAGRYLTYIEKGVENRFSNPFSSKCGYYADDEVCGNSTANGVKLFKKNAKIYNKRGDWYK